MNNFQFFLHCQYLKIISLITLAYRTIFNRSELFRQDRLNRTQKLRGFFKRKYRYDKLKKLGAPSCVLDEEIKLIHQSITDLAKLNIDAIATFNSIKGQTAYLIECANEDQRTNAENHCGQCEHYFLIDVKNRFESGCTKGLIPQGNYPIICKTFSDTTESFATRLADGIKRCWHCKHAINRIEVIDANLKIEHYDCPFELSLLNLDCAKEQPKES